MRKATRRVRPGQRDMGCKGLDRERQMGDEGGRGGNCGRCHPATGRAAYGTVGTVLFGGHCQPRYSTAGAQRSLEVACWGHFSLPARTLDGLVAGGLAKNRASRNNGLGPRGTRQPVEKATRRGGGGAEERWMRADGCSDNRIPFWMMRGGLE